ncbi:unnamed protein product [Symbiodinium natans]|uniref:Uncharacterized protein n=1 Tax=Symbiodinium natans TaxID=878477 RepID=A0A812VAQ4_9DINO|nr:unnamed protein product [Symbiodinium natans]
MAAGGAGVPATAVLNRRPRPNIYELPDASRDVLGEYTATLATPVREATRQSAQYLQAQKRRGFSMAFLFWLGALHDETICSR